MEHSTTTQRHYLLMPTGLFLIIATLVGFCIFVACIFLVRHSRHLLLMVPYALLFVFPLTALWMHARRERARRQFDRRSSS